MPSARNASRPVIRERCVAIGIPPSPKACEHIVSAGTSRAKASQISPNNSSRDSTWYLSRYFVARRPERRVKLPVRNDTGTWIPVLG